MFDQHFSQRRRLSRLLTVVAQNPRLKGVDIDENTLLLIRHFVGIDENTALLAQHDVGIEVIGQGSVVLPDGRHVISNSDDIDEGGPPEMADVRLHPLPAGSRHLPGASNVGKGASDIVDAIPAPVPLQAFPEKVV